jgi:hypothetical protein
VAIYIEAELDKLPEARQRLVLEFLPLLWQALKDERGPEMLLVLLAGHPTPISLDRLAEYKGWAKRISKRVFDLLDGDAAGCRDKPLLQMTLELMMARLRTNDPEEFERLFGVLERHCHEGDDLRRKMLQRIRRGWGKQGH